MIASVSVKAADVLKAHKALTDLDTAKARLQYALAQSKSVARGSALNHIFAFDTAYIEEVKLQIEELVVEHARQRVDDLKEDLANMGIEVEAD